jgi:hypothetical protein
MGIQGILNTLEYDGVSKDIRTNIQGCALLFSDFILMYFEIISTQCAKDCGPLRTLVRNQEIKLNMPKKYGIKIFDTHSTFYHQKWTL